jgi:hypothetical protein
LDTRVPIRIEQIAGTPERGLKPLAHLQVGVVAVGDITIRISQGFERTRL